MPGGDEDGVWLSDGSIEAVWQTCFGCVSLNGHEQLRCWEEVMRALNHREGLAGRKTAYGARAARWLHIAYILIHVIFRHLFHRSKHLPLLTHHTETLPLHLPHPRRRGHILSYSKFPLLFAFSIPRAPRPLYLLPVPSFCGTITTQLLLFAYLHLSSSA